MDAVSSNQEHAARGSRAHLAIRALEDLTKQGGKAEGEGGMREGGRAPAGSSGSGGRQQERDDPNPSLPAHPLTFPLLLFGSLVPIQRTASSSLLAHPLLLLVALLLAALLPAIDCQARCRAAERLRGRDMLGCVRRAIGWRALGCSAAEGKVVDDQRR